jgi:hypothetical protein
MIKITIFYKEIAMTYSINCRNCWHKLRQGHCRAQFS